MLPPEPQSREPFTLELCSRCSRQEPLSQQAEVKAEINKSMPEVLTAASDAYHPCLLSPLLASALFKIVALKSGGSLPLLPEEAVTASLRGARQGLTGVEGCLVRPPGREKAPGVHSGNQTPSTMGWPPAESSWKLFGSSIRSNGAL